MPNRIYLTRHGTRQDKSNKKWYSDAYRQYDPPLSYKGVDQAINIGNSLKGSKLITYSSPFIRSIQTAHHICDRIGSKIRIEKSLSEICRSRWFNERPQFIATKDLWEHYHTVDRSHEQYPCSLVFPERRRHSKNRVEEFLKNVVLKEKYDVLLVSHGFPIKDCLHFLANHIEMPPVGKLYTLENREEKWVLLNQEGQ